MNTNNRNWKLLLNTEWLFQYFCTAVPQLFSLREVTKVAVDPETLIEKSLARISENYPDKEIGMTAFYRESICENNLVIQEIEAVIGINKSSYSDG